MALSDLTVDAVTAALEEFDQIGGPAFRAKYGFGEAREYVIVRNGDHYDSKAIVGVAHGYLPGRSVMASNEFTGGAESVVKKLESLGFKVRSQRDPAWVRDEIILVCDVVYLNGWKGLDRTDPRAAELSALLQKLPFHSLDNRGPRFRNQNGVARKSADIATWHPDYVGGRTKGGATDRVVLAQFLEDPERMHRIAAEIRAAIDSGAAMDEFYVPEELETEGATEGRLLQRKHFVRERNPKLRDKKIASFLKTHNRVHCELCEFDFEDTYGERGRGFIEVHHVVPLHESGPTKTNLDDMILVCPNCHRMIHRGMPWLTPEDVRKIIR